MLIILLIFPFTDLYAFEQCYALSVVVLTSGLKILSNNMFRYAYSLKEVTIVSTITSLGKDV